MFKELLLPLVDKFTFSIFSSILLSEHHMPL